MMRFITFTAKSICLCGVCSPVVVLGLSVRLLWYPYLCCESGCCRDCDACTVVCVACVLYRAISMLRYNKQFSQSFEFQTDILIKKIICKFKSKKIFTRAT